MFLKSLQLLGFKTFARQTEITFDGGVTAIVGPNGSGKTNIVDSVKWVLGSGQAKDLRGKKMEEVIYAGGERRSRAWPEPRTHLMESTMFVLPEPLGPTMAVTPPSNWISVCRAKVLKPSNCRDLRNKTGGESSRCRAFSPLRR